MTKLFALGGLGAIGAGTFAAVRARRRAAAKQQEIDSFDFTDLEEPVVVTEDIFVVTEAGPYDVDVELYPADDR